MPFLAILAVLAILGLFFISLYNSLVRKKTMAEEGWSGVDVQLKRRTDLIPNLIETVKGYAGHEKTVLEQVTAFRSQSAQAATIDDKVKAEGLLSGALGRLFAVAENYPDLKANVNFQDLQKSLAEIEDQIQMARRYYNGTVRELNMAVQTFPSNIVANSFHFEKMEFFEIENEADKAVPKVSF